MESRTVLRWVYKLFYSSLQEVETNSSPLEYRLYLMTYFWWIDFGDQVRGWQTTVSGQLLSFINKVVLEHTMPICLHSICGCFCTKATEVSSMQAYIDMQSQYLLSIPLSLPIPKLGHRKHCSFLLDLNLLWRNPAALSRGHSHGPDERLHGKERRPPANSYVSEHS